jgi:regulator of replication initiation timing
MNPDKPNETPTPRIDVAELELMKQGGMDEKRVMSAFDFARTIERENSKLKFAVDYGRECENKLNDVTVLYHKSEQENAELRRELDSCRAALDGQPCNEDWKKETKDMTDFAKRCMDERDELRLELESLRHKKMSEVTPALIFDYAKVQAERDKLKQQVTALLSVAEKMAVVCHRASLEQILVNNGDDGGFGCQTTLEPTQASIAAKATLSAFAEFKKEHNL